MTNTTFQRIFIKRNPKNSVHNVHYTMDINTNCLLPYCEMRNKYYMICWIILRTPVRVDDLDKEICKINKYIKKLLKVDVNEIHTLEKTVIKVDSRCRPEPRKYFEYHYRFIVNNVSELGGIVDDIELMIQFDIIHYIEQKKMFKLKIK